MTDILLLPAVYLAYLTAVTHGLTEDAERLKPLVEAPGLEMPDESPASARLLQPPTPIIRTKDGSEKDQGVREEDATVNWPQLTVPKSAFEGSLADTPDGLSAPEEDYGDAIGDAWGDDLNLDDDAPSTSAHGRPLRTLELCLSNKCPPPLV